MANETDWQANKVKTLNRMVVVEEQGPAPDMAFFFVIEKALETDANGVLSGAGQVRSYVNLKILPKDLQDAIRAFVHERVEARKS